MKLGNIELPAEAYVVIGENDGVGAENREGRPFAFETYLDDHCSLEYAKQRQRHTNGRFGHTCLARLTFIGEESHE
jgi:hypothetical protein